MLWILAILMKQQEEKLNEKRTCVKILFVALTSQVEWEEAKSTSRLNIRFIICSPVVKCLH